MKITKITLFAFIITLIFINYSVAQSSSILVIQGSRKHGCYLSSPSNLLISLTKGRRGEVLNFKVELNRLNKNIKRIKAAKALLRGKRDDGLKRKIKKYNQALKDARLALKGITACRDNANSETISPQLISLSCINKSDLNNCDDLNPCTINDRCFDSVCRGTAISDGTKLKCSFSSCSTEVLQCLNGNFIVCVVGAASNELCNGLDDDCNGLIDENDVCPIDIVVTPTVTPSFNPEVDPTPIKQPTLSPTNTATVTTTPTRTSTPTRTPTPLPQAPFTCIAPSAPNGNSNLNPNGCPCKQNGNCSGDCQCGISCQSNPSACPAGTTCNQDGKCSGVCLDSIFNQCVGGSNQPICIPNDNGNRSAKDCPCIINGNCAGDCKCGVSCQTNPSACPAGTTCNQDGKCSGFCLGPSTANACT